VKAVAKAVLLAAITVAALGVDKASAQGWGPAVGVKDIDPVIRAAAEVMGIVRTRGLVVGQVNLPEYVGTGTMVDMEAATPGESVEVSRYSYAVAIHLQASRLDYEGPQTPRKIRVVKGGRAWDEAWNEDKTNLNTSPSSSAAYRAQMIWLQPHAFLHAAAFASGKKCLDGKACTTAVKVGTENGKPVIEVQVDGGPTRRRSEPTSARADRTMVTPPSGGSKKAVATYSDYRPVRSRTPASHERREGCSRPLPLRHLLAVARRP